MKVTLIASLVALATALPHQLVERDPQLSNLAAGAGNLAGNLISLPVSFVGGLAGGLVNGVVGPVVGPVESIVGGFLPWNWRQIQAAQIEAAQAAGAAETAQ